MQRFEQALASKPEEIRYCEGDFSPRWVARWGSYQEQDGYQKFATGVCFVDQDALECRLTHHVTVANSHEVIDLKYDIPLQRIIDLYAAVKADHPTHELAMIRYRTVTGGGKWSPELDGYTIYLLAPPEYSSGEAASYVLSRGGERQWIEFNHEEPIRWWRASTADKWLRDRERELGTPLTKTLNYLGR